MKESETGSGEAFKVTYRREKKRQHPVFPLELLEKY